MKTFTVISIFLLFGCTKGQFGGLWNGGAFNPWNNPNHPANRGIANGIAARNLFAWPAAPFIRTAPIPSVVADSPALNIDGVAEEHQDALNDALERKKAIDAKIREAAFGGGSVAASFRPGFVNDLLKERMQLVNEIRRTQQEAVRDRLALVAKRQEIAKQIAESTEPITFGLLMQSLNRAYGREMAAKSIAHQRKMMQKFDKPFLRPVVSVFAPNGLPSGAVAETKIYQNFQEQKGTLLKDEDIFVVTKLSGFSGDKLHLGVDLHAVNETLSDAQALSEDFLETELEFQDEMLESQMTLSQRWLDLQLGDPEEQTKFQEKIMKKQLSRAEKLMEIKGKLAERQRELEEKMAEKQQDLIEKELKRQQKLMKKQQKQFEKELKKQQKQLEKQAKAEAKALERQMDLAGKFSDSGFIQQQLDFAKQQALLNIPSKRQQKIEEGLEFLRNKIHSLTGGDDALLQKQLRAAEKLEEKQRELEQKRLEKQRELLEKQAEKERDLLKKQLEKEHDLREKLLEQEAKAAEKLNDKLEKERELAQKEVERQQDLAEKEAELFEKLREKETEKAQKELEKEADAVQKKLEKEQKLAEKERERIQKELEKEQDKLEKEQEKAQKLLEKELEKAEKQLEKEHEKAIKQMEKEQKSAEKQLEKELKQREKENDLLEKRLEKEQELHLDSIPISDTIPQNPFVHLPFNQYIPRFGPPNGFRF